MEKQFDYDGVQVNYTITGKGPAVMLVHGFAEDGTIWKEQVDFLQGYCMLIIPELPGSGKSALPIKDTVAIEDFAAILAEILNRENIEKGVILGHSMGGYITLAFAEMYPKKVVGFSLVHSTAFADSDEKKNVRKRGIDLIRGYGPASFIKNTTPNLFSEQFKQTHPEEVNELIEKGQHFSADALIQYYAAMMNRPDRTAVLQKAEVPVLFIIGSEDVAAPMADLLKQVHLPNVSYIHMVESVGHMGMMEKPAEINDYLLKFIKDCSE